MDAHRPSPPLATWGALAAIAVGGSLLYGASLSWVIPSWRAAGGAAWMATSAGLAWCAFGPALLILARKPILVVAHACLVTMAYGEAILALGAMTNGLLAAVGFEGPASAAWNLGCVAASNVAMGTALAVQLLAVGVPAWKTALAWVFVLDGLGALLFWTTRHWPGGDGLMLRKNPLTMVGTIRRCWLLTRQAPAEEARLLLPPQLELVTHRGLAFWNVVVCEIAAMRPLGMPAFAGVGYRHAAYRLYARFRPDQGEPVEGLWFARSDCDSPVMAAMGNLMTDFRFQHSPIALDDRPGAVEIAIRAKDAPAHAVVGQMGEAQLPGHSAFGSLEEAAAFLKYKPAGLSVDAKGRVNVVKIVRREEDWRARLVPVLEERWAYFDDKATRPEVCFQVEPIDYRWNRGTIYRVETREMAARQSS